MLIEWDASFIEGILDWVEFWVNFALQSHLIFINFAVLQFRLALLLECYDYQGHENIHEEERKHNEIYDIKYGHFNPEILYWTPIFVGGSHRMLQYSVLYIRIFNISHYNYIIIEYAIQLNQNRISFRFRFNSKLTQERIRNCARFVYWLCI